MRKKLLFFLLLVCTAFYGYAQTSKNVRPFQFGVMNYPKSSEPFHLQNEINRIIQKPLDFIVVNSLRAENEPCDDDLYLERKNQLNQSPKPLFFSLAGKDWIGCQNNQGDDIRIERLQRLRQILFEAPTSLGIHPLPLYRQSNHSRHLDFPENMHWQHQSIFFVTLHLPSDNNHYLTAAGRNNEFEERKLANHDWLKRAFTLAKRKNCNGIVIFCDGNPFKDAENPDGFKEIRTLIAKLASQFSGKVLLIHHEPDSNTKRIQWKNNLGIIAAGSTWQIISVDPQKAKVFSTGSLTKN